MKGKIFLVVLLILLTFSFCIAQARQSFSNKSANAQTTGKYRIMSEDLLDVHLSNFTHGYSQVRVDCSGLIVLPLVGEINVLGKTLDEVKAELETKYSEYLKSPSISIFLKESHKDAPVRINGAVWKPLSFQLKRNVRLLEALSFAGGFTDKAGEIIRITHTTCVTSANKDKSPLVYKRTDVSYGDEKSNPYILPGDTITVLESEPIYVVGNVCFPQTIYFSHSSTLRAAIASVGGVLNDANLEKIRIIRQSANKTKTVLLVNLRAILEGKIGDFALQPEDIIDVPCKICKQTIPCPNLYQRIFQRIVQ